VSRATATLADPGQLAQRPAAPEAIPQLAARQTAVSTTLASDQPVLTRIGLEEPLARAQDIAVRDPRVLAELVTDGGEPLRSEVFGVYPLGPADITEATAACRDRACYRVEIYNFAANSTVLAVVDTAAAAIVAVERLDNTQPTVVPRELMDLAAQIAMADPDVRDALGIAPDAAMIQQPQMKVQFQATACERSRHLCVAPIFVWGERALWVIVDLTAYELVGLRWTELGASGRVPISEQQLQDDVVTARYCEQATALNRDGWELEHILTGSDGLRIDNVRFNGTPVLRSAKLVDIHISYSTNEGFGYTDALGCPRFSQAAVVAWNGPRIEELPDGFALTQRFRSEFWPMPCNYAYVQRYEFFRDGSFRVAFVNEGRGCGTDGTYRPVMRIAPALEQARFAEWDGSAWQEWPSERWALQQPTSPATPEGFQFRILGADGQGYAIEPGRGQFDDNAAGDNAYLFVSRLDPARDEGESELATLGDCCNTDERQGPERFLEPAEPLGTSPLVLWYVPQLANSGVPGAERCWADAVVEDGLLAPRVWPCAAGPRFVPIGGG
jgi:hypothetical protein